MWNDGERKRENRQREKKSNDYEANAFEEIAEARIDYRRDSAMSVKGAGVEKKKEEWTRKKNKNSKNQREFHTILNLQPSMA